MCNQGLRSRKNPKTPGSANIIPETFLLTVADTLGKPPLSRRKEPGKPAQNREKSHFACRRSAGHDRTKYERYCLSPDADPTLSPDLSPCGTHSMPAGTGIFG
jgi:hypothetical protein